MHLDLLYDEPSSSSIHDSKDAHKDLPLHGKFPEELMDYCQAEYPNPDEYSKPENADLLMATVVTRHGDRSPIAVLSFENVTWQCHVPTLTFPFPDFSVAPQHQIFTDVRLRISEDNPFKTAMWAGSCSPGQLTGRGAIQHVKLGNHLGKIYEDLLYKGLYVRSTNKGRTIQSAESNLAGLNSALREHHGSALTEPVTKKVSGGHASEDYPSYPYPVAIHTLPVELETMHPNLLACPRLKQLWHDREGHDPEWSQFIKDHAQLKRDLDNIMGDLWESPDYRSFDHYFDSIAARTCHRKSLPCSPTTHECVTEDLAKAVFKAGQWENERLFFTSPKRDEIIRISIGSWLGDVLNGLEAWALNKPQRHTFAFHSGHDTTIGPLLGALGATGTDRRWPAYASNVVIELWKKKEDDNATQNEKQLFVRVLYNGKVLQSEVCDMSWCPLDTFRDRLLTYVPVELVNECAPKQTDSDASASAPANALSRPEQQEAAVDKVESSVVDTPHYLDFV
ncbi:histidine phosphatase superfamily [Gaertneriomyces semiglobifer]|nr:histidine phosphatase superfamily [Gaertneriomyces semiglobifer]